MHPGCGVAHYKTADMNSFEKAIILFTSSCFFQCLWYLQPFFEAVLKSFSSTRAEDKGALSLKALLNHIPSTRSAFQVPLHLLPMLEKADILTL